MSGVAVQVRSFEPRVHARSAPPSTGPLVAAPVAAVLTDGPSDAAVADAAAELAGTRGAPLLLVVVTPVAPVRLRQWAVDPAGAVAARVAPRLTARDADFDVVPLTLPVRTIATQSAARLLALADLHRVATIVTAPDAPHGLDAAGLRNDLQVLARSRAPRVVAAPPVRVPGESVAGAV